MGRPCICGATELTSTSMRGWSTSMGTSSERNDRDQRLERRHHARRRAPHRPRDFGGSGAVLERATRSGGWFSGKCGHSGGFSAGTQLRRRGHRPPPHRALLFGAERDRLVKAMFVAAEESRREGDYRHAEARFDDRLRRGPGVPALGFRGHLPGDAGLPVTIRLLDPPLHEFLTGGVLRG